MDLFTSSPAFDTAFILETKTVNKSELIDAIVTSEDIPKATATKALNGAIQAITNELKKKESVTLVGFGTFYVGERKARTGRNPKTGEAIEIPASLSPKFRAGKTLKDAVDEKKAPAKKAAKKKK